MDMKTTDVSTPLQNSNNSLQVYEKPELTIFLFDLDNEVMQTGSQTEGGGTGTEY